VTIVDDKPGPKAAATVGAYEAKTRFSELIARAEKGESFLVTKNGRPVARIEPAVRFDREKARQAAEWIRTHLAKSPRVSEAESQRNWEELKADIERDLDERVDRWRKS
jgi:prevent-host-death family protein